MRDKQALLVPRIWEKTSLLPLPDYVNPHLPFRFFFNCFDLNYLSVNKWVELFIDQKVNSFPVLLLELWHCRTEGLSCCSEIPGIILHEFSKQKVLRTQPAECC